MHYFTQTPVQTSSKNSLFHQGIQDLPSALEHHSAPDKKTNTQHFLLINQKYILGTQPLHVAPVALWALDFLLAPADLSHTTGLCFLVGLLEDYIYKCFIITNWINT